VRPVGMCKATIWLLHLSGILIAGSAAILLARQQDTTTARRIDPAAWGSDHVGKPFPPYVTGDECLFCHRDIGPTWQDNPHQRTIRPAAPDEPGITILRDVPGGRSLAADTKHLLGSRHVTRFAKRSGQYGRLDLLTATYRSANNQLSGAETARWDANTFANRCAGCHTTAVNSQSRTFAALSLDCFTCHGDVDLDHTKDVRLALLSSKNRPPREVISICGQCHLRGGITTSTGLPYPNTFVPGDNLFRDFQVDFSDTAIASVPDIDQHIFLNARNVAMLDQRETTCLTCHDLHDQSTDKHQQVPKQSICNSCHVSGSGSLELREAVHPSARLRAHSRTCDY